MDESERILGRLEEFQKNAERRFDSADKRFDSLEGKVDSLNQFKWRIAGGAAVLGVLLGIIGNVTAKLLLGG